MSAASPFRFQNANVRTRVLVASVHSATNTYGTRSALARLLTRARKKSVPVESDVPSATAQASSLARARAVASRDTASSLSTAPFGPRSGLTTTSHHIGLRVVAVGK